LQPLLVYSSDSIYINSLPFSSITSIAYDPLTQFYYFTDNLTNRVLRVKINSEPDVFFTFDDCKINNIAIDILDRSLYVMTDKGIVVFNMDIDSRQQRIVNEDDGIAEFSQIHGQLAFASSNRLTLVSRLGQSKDLDVRIRDTTPIYLTVDHYDDQLLIVRNNDETVIEKVDYAGTELSSLDISATANVIAVDSKSYFVPVAGGVAVIAKYTLEEEHVISTGIESIVDMTVSYYAPEGGCGDCSTATSWEELICDAQHNYGIAQNLTACKTKGQAGKGWAGRWTDRQR
jgi:hypothetical protein